MISSVIVKLDCDAETRQQVIGEISDRRGLDVGDLQEGRMLPVTIETTGNQQTEELTRWMMTLDGVAFVDVVFVHFEETDTTTAPTKRRSKRTVTEN